MGDGDPRARTVAATERAATKRSQTVSTMLVAGAGLAALGLGSLTRTAPSKDVLVYPDPAACAAEGIRPADACRSEYATARAAYPRTAPHYDTLDACARHHGSFRCLTDATATGPQGIVPRMAGYMIGRSAAQGVTPEPVYDHASGHGGHNGHGGSYCTGSGSRVSTGSGGSASSGKLVASKGKTAFGGFGGSGKSFSSFGS